MLAGALFLAFNVAPTEEMILIAYQDGAWHAWPWSCVSLLLLHALGLRGRLRGPGGARRTAGLARTFLRLHDPRLRHRAAGQPLCAVDLRPDRRQRDRPGRGAVVVLGFPAAIGAAIARLVV